MIDVEKYALDFTIYGHDLMSGEADFTPDGDFSSARKENISKGELHLSAVHLVLTFGKERMTDGDLRIVLGRPRD